MPVLFKSMLIYTLPQKVNIAPDDLEEKLAAKGSRYIGQLERNAVHCWAPPGGKQSNVYLHDIQGQRLIQMKTQKRKISNSEVKERMEEAVLAEEKRTGERMHRKAKTELRNRIIDEMLPNAPINITYTPMWWDTKNHRMVVGATSRKTAEALLDLLRETLGSLSVVPMTTDTQPMTAMTNWLREPAKRPGWMQFGDKAVLTSMSSEDGRFSGSKVDLEAQEIEHMLETGCRASQVALKMTDQATFELTQDFAFKNIKIEDAVRDNYGDDETDGNPVAELETEFLIVSDTLSWVIDQITSELGGEVEKEPAELMDA